MTVDFTDELCIPEQRPDDIDMQILRNVRRTAARSNTLMNELKTLKSKVYGLENDLRHL
jgi:coiled-coil domain-containing protein 77